VFTIVIVLSVSTPNRYLSDSTASLLVGLEFVYGGEIKTFDRLCIILD